MFMLDHPYRFTWTASIKEMMPRKPLAAIVDMIRPLAMPNEVPSAGMTMETARILVISDNNRQYGQVVSSLISSGYTAQVAENGIQALTLLELIAFDLILLELKTPTLDGLSILKAIKNNAQTSQLPVIMMSSQNDVEAAIQCIRSGAEDYLFTPLQGNLLRERIHASLERKSARKQMQVQLEDATLLLAAAKMLNATLNPVHMMQSTFTYAVKRLKPSAGLIGEVRNSVLTVTDSVGFGERFTTFKQLPLSEMGWQSALEAERPYLAQNRTLVKDTSDLDALASCLVVPFKRNKEILAVMLLYQTQDSSAAALTFVDQLMKDTADALWNAHLYNEVVGCADQYLTQISTVSREMKLTSTTIKEYTSALEIDTGEATRDMRTRMLDAIRHNANHLFLLATELETRAKKPKIQEPPACPKVDRCADADDKRAD